MPFRSFLLAAAAAVSLAPAASAGWSEWQLAGESQITGEPSVVITANKHIYIMARGADDALWWTVSKNGGSDWRGWERAGGLLTSSPACLEPIPNVVECYVRNAENGVSQIDRIDGRWGDWFGLGGTLTTNVSAFAAGEDNRRVFGIATDGLLAIRAWDQAIGGWQDWNTFRGDGKLFPGTQALVSCAPLAGNTEQLEGGPVTAYQFACVVRRSKGGHAMIWGSEAADSILQFTSQTIDINPGTDYPASVLARSSPDGMLADVFVVAKDSAMMSATYLVGSGWTTSFEPIGNGQFSAGPSCDRGKAFKNVTMVCAGRGMDGAVWFSVRTPD